MEITDKESGKILEDMKKPYKIMKFPDGLIEPYLELADCCCLWMSYHPYVVESMSWERHQLTTGHLRPLSNFQKPLNLSY